MKALLAVVGLVVVMVLVIVLEGRRQEHRYGRSRGRGTAMMRVGLLELQRHLEPERRIEQLVERAEPLDQDEIGEPPAPPGPAAP